MEGLAGLIDSGQIAALMLGVLVLEALVLWGVYHVSGRGIAPLDLLLNLGAGGSLMVALYLALSDAPWQWLATSLIVALIFHCADLTRRWR